MSQSLFAASLLTVVALLTATVLPLPQPAALTMPAAVTLAALLLLPAVLDKPLPVFGLLRDSAAWSGFAGVCAGLSLIGSANTAVIAGAAIAVTLIVWTSAALWMLLDRHLPTNGRWRFTAALSLAAGAPLWAAPLAEMYAPLATPVACISPLSLLGVLVDYDYLRSAFFYQHSALGALAYRYPSAGAFAGFYAMAATLLWALALTFRMKTEDAR